MASHREEGLRSVQARPAHYMTGAREVRPKRGRVYQSQNGIVSAKSMVALRSEYRSTLQGLSNRYRSDLSTLRISGYAVTNAVRRADANSMRIEREKAQAYDHSSGKN